MRAVRLPAHLNGPRAWLNVRMFIRYKTFLLPRIAWPGDAAGRLHDQRARIKPVCGP